MNTYLRETASVVALAAAAGFLASPSATAADYTPTYQPPPIVTNWQAFYLGGHFGGGEAEYEGIFKGIPAPSSSNVLFDRADPGGMLGGFHFGYNWDDGDPYVWGVEADFSFMSWDDRVPAVSSSESGMASVDMLGSVRGRLGFVTGEDRSGLIYMTAGLAFTDADATAIDPSGTPSRQALDLGGVGGVIGGGFEWAYTDTFRIRAETLYYMFDESNPITLTAASPGDHATFDDAWVVRVGGSWYMQHH